MATGGGNPGSSSVDQILPGAGIQLNPPGGTGNVRVTNTGVQKLIAGPGVTLTPASGTGAVEVSAAGSATGVSQIIPGADVVVSPSGGTGAVTVNFADQDPLIPFGWYAETWPRFGPGMSNQTGVPLKTGIITFVPIRLLANVPIAKLAFEAGSTGASSITNFWYCLFDDGRGASSTPFNSYPTLTQLGVTGVGGASFPANTAIPLTLSSTYTTAYSGVYHLGIMMQAASATVSAFTMLGGTAQSVQEWIQQPYVCSSGGSGLTTPATCPATVVLTPQASAALACFMYAKVG